MDATQSEGYKKLLAAARADEDRWPGFHDYFAKVAWVVERAEHYAEKTGLAASAILDAWETNRDYWYMNYYQESNQPRLGGERVRVFETKDDLLTAVGKLGFRCPKCNGVSTSPYVCDSGETTNDFAAGRGQIVCDWKVYGLFSDLGRGVHVFVKSEMRGSLIFMPVAWEQAPQEA